MEAEEKKLIEQYEEYAQKNGLKINPDKNLINGLVGRLLANEKKYGARYCPCRIVKGQPEIDEKNICPCSYSREEIEKNGHCLCWLFFKK